MLPENINTYVEVILFVANIVLIWVITPITKRLDNIQVCIRNLEQSDDELAKQVTESNARLGDRIAGVELKMAEQYVQRSEVNRTLEAMDDKLDKIFAKIERLDHMKADKS